MDKTGRAKNESESANLATATTTVTEHRYARKLYCYLWKGEMLMYWVLWLGSVSYASYCLHLQSRKHEGSMYTVEPVQPWWSFGRTILVDTADNEWSTWKEMATSKYLFIVTLYPVLSQLVKKNFNAWIIHFSALYSVISTVYLVGLPPTLFMSLQIAVIFAAFWISNKAIVVWSVAMIYMQCKEYYPLNEFYRYFSNESWYFEGYLTMIALAWINARCVSFCLDRIWGRVDCESTILASLVNIIAYCFYLPLCIMGPLITSKQFKEGMLSKAGANLNLKFILMNIARYSGFVALTQLMTFLFYQQAFTLYPALVRSLDMWALCGMGYLMGQFFHLKYVVMYGCSCFLAKLDDIDAPPDPIWIGRVSLYSEMWRHFDAGLHKFMHNYIYTPLAQYAVTFKGKMASSFVCFTFVYFWHGTADFVLIWSILNCIGIVLEGLGRELGKAEIYVAWESGMFGEEGQRRLHALLRTPLFLMSCLSNFYFFAGKEVGHIIAERIFFDSWPRGFPALLFFLYTGSQVSIEVKNHELQRVIDSDLKKDKNL